jgi:hypothetical protein
MEDFPDHAPSLFVVEPVLFDHSHRRLSEYGTSATMHVLSPDAAGNVQICHYDDDHWTPDVTLAKVVLKSIIWLEAYEAHRRTGMSIDHYLGHM